MLRKMLALALFGLAGCNNETANIQQPVTACFSVISNNGNQPFSSILLNACTGDTWLLVKTNMTDKREDGFTYQWMKFTRLDFAQPVLSSGP